MNLKNYYFGAVFAVFSLLFLAVLVCLFLFRGNAWAKPAAFSPLEDPVNQKLENQEFDRWLSAHPNKGGFETFGDFYNILRFLEKARIGKGEKERVDAALQILLADAINNLAKTKRRDHEGEK